MPRPLRFLALAEGKFGPFSSKTANACIRYTPEQVVAVLDSTQVGRTSDDVLGFGGAIPVVGTLADGLAHEPNALLIGIAPPGGQLPAEWKSLLADAIRAKLDIWSGLHFFIADDPDLRALAEAEGVAIHDLRRPPEALDVARGRVRDLDATIVLTVGTDCNIGKMTAALQIRDAMKRQGLKVAFAGTGQTGILIEGSGIAVDAVVADFISGAAEKLTVDAARAHDADVVLVEGQGSIIHPSYSGVTYGLLHGSMPHAMIMCAQPSRVAINNCEWVPIPDLPSFIRMHEAVASPLRPSKVIAVALNTVDLSEADALAAIEQVARETGLPTTDPVRFDSTPIGEAVWAFHQARIGKQPAADGRQPTAAV